MVKKADLSSNNEMDNKIKELKLELSKEKGLLASKTKTVNSAKKKNLRKQIARLLTQKNKKKVRVE
jgi:large subunit ribosomal protein L29